MTTIHLIATVLVAYVVIDVLVTFAAYCLCPSVRNRINARFGGGK